MVELTPRRNSTAHQRTESVACIVIGWNIAPFLKECLDSIYAQKRIPDEVAYVDDGSTDESRQIALQYTGRGLKLHLTGGRRGMCAARNKGVEETQGEFLLFVDGDNILPADYVATMLAEIGEADQVYPCKRFFGEGERFEDRMRRTPSGFWQPREHDRAALWEQNYADTCSLIRRDALFTVGGWQENALQTLQDWSLALRLSGRGEIRRSTAVLGYRVHGSNWSERDRGKTRQEINGFVRRHAASISVACVWSGRLAGLWYRWLSALRRSLEVTGKTAEFIVIDDSPEGFPGLSCDGTFTAVHVRRVHRGTNCTERRKDRRGTAEFLSGVCNDVMRLAGTDIVWFVEDDIVVPKNAASDMLEALLQGPKPLAAVGGFYRSRHGPDRFVASRVGQEVVYLTDLPEEPEAVDFTGTGCLMLLRDLVRGVRFSIEWHHGKYHSSGHDWTFAWRLQLRGTPVIMLPDVVCRHYQTEDKFV